MQKILNQFSKSKKAVLWLSAVSLGVITHVCASTPTGIKSYPRPFLTDIANKITSSIGSGLNPDEIVKIVRREVRVDQAVICLKRDTNANGIFYTRLHSRSDYNGVVTDEAEKTVYASMFTNTKVTEAITEANKGAAAGTTNRVTKIIPMFITLNSSGMMQNFQVNISVLDKENLCMARFSVPENTNIADLTKLTPPSATPATSNSFRESVAGKIEEKWGNSTYDEIMQSVVKEVEVEEAVICMVRLGSSFFRLHSRSGNDGIIAAAESADYQRFYEAIKAAIIAKNPGWVEGGSQIAVRPELIPPLDYKLKNAAGVEQTFSIYPMVIDGTHFCFGRILHEAEAAPAAKPPAPTPTPTLNTGDHNRG